MNNLDTNILWQGKISVKKAIVSVGRYCVVTQDSITIRKNEREDSKVEVLISKDTVVGVDAPQFGAKEVLLTGYRGIGIQYKDQEGKVKNVRFWAKGFGAYPNKEQTQKLVDAVNRFSGNTQAKALVIGGNENVIMTVSILAGFFTSGLVGLVIMAIASSLAFNVYNQPSLQKEIRILISGVILGGAFLASLVIGCAVGIFILSATS